MEGWTEETCYGQGRVLMAIILIVDGLIYYFCVAALSLKWCLEDLTN